MLTPTSAVPFAAQDVRATHRHTESWELSRGQRDPHSLLCLFNQSVFSSPEHCPNALGFNSLTKRKNLDCFTHRNEETKFLLWKLDFLLGLEKLGHFIPKDLTYYLLLPYYFRHGKFMFPIGFGLAGGY